MDTGVKAREYFARKDVTDQEWEELEQQILDEGKEHWQKYLERTKDYDDAVYYPEYNEKYLLEAVSNKGYVYRWAVRKLETGELLIPETKKGKYGYYWILKTLSGDFVGFLNHSSATTDQKQQQYYNSKGYELLWVRVRVIGETPSSGFEYDWNDYEVTGVLGEEVNQDA